MKAIRNVYSVDAHDGEPVIYFATKREALAEARRAAARSCPAGEVVEVELVELVDLTRARVVDLLNMRAHKATAEARVIETIPSARMAVNS